MASRKIVRANGTIVYFNDDNEYHRDDGPAIIDVCGDKYWLINDRLHRLDGPASEFGDGGKEWFIMDKYVDVGTQEDFERSVQYRKWMLKAFK